MTYVQRKQLVYFLLCCLVPFILLLTEPISSFAIVTSMSTKSPNSFLQLSRQYQSIQGLRKIQNLRLSSTRNDQQHIDQHSCKFIKELDGPFTPQLFASSKCWSFQPLLVRNAFPTSEQQHNRHDNIHGWPTIEDLQFLASDEDAEVRLITHEPGNEESFELHLGPFAEEEVDQLLSDSDGTKASESPVSKWTLIINDVDRFLPSLSDWMSSTFSFVPTWRRDDGQMSYSNKGGGIGRHVDNYDVFLIQTSGVKEWRVGKQFITHHEEMERLIPGIDVRILRRDHSEKHVDDDEFVLIVNPGDLLYLPPRVTHKGAALTNDCGTVSVGCRAPSASDMITQLAEDISMATTGASVERYSDPHVVQALVEGGNSIGRGEITEEAKEHARRLIRNAMDEILSNDDVWDEWFGKFVTEAKRIRNSYPVPLSSDGNDEENEWIESLGEWGDPKLAVQAIVDGKGSLYQAEGIVFAYSKESSSSGGKNRLFVNGECWETDPAVPVEIIANERRITKYSFPEGTLGSKTQALLEELLLKGLLYGSDQ